MMVFSSRGTSASAYSKLRAKNWYQKSTIIEIATSPNAMVASAPEMRLFSGTSSSMILSCASSSSPSAAGGAPPSSSSSASGS